MFEQLKKENPKLINIGKKWSKEEEKKLLTKLDEGNKCEDLVNEFKRTEGGLISHLKQMAMYMIEDGQDIDEVSNITKLSKTAITNYINKKNPKIDKDLKTEIKQLFSLMSVINSKLDLIIDKSKINSDEFFDCL